MTSCATTSACDTISGVLTASLPAGTAAAPAAPGTGALAISCHDGRSRVTRAYATSPLRLLNPANHGHSAWIYTSSFGGGLVDGDETTLDIDVGPGAAAYVSTQSSTKVYRSPRGTKAMTRGIVGARGLLVVVPDPVVPFAGARYRQVQRYDVAADAGLVVADAVSCGRRASGERWRFDEYESVIEVRVGGRLRVYDAVALRARDGDLATRCGRFNVLAVAIAAGESLRAEIAGLTALPPQPVSRRPEQVVAVSPLGDDACIVRIAGTTAEAVVGTLRHLLGFVRVRLADDPWTRKW
jgi:urease accessory protein